MKLVIIFYLAAVFSKGKQAKAQNGKVLIVHCILLLATVGLVFIEPDLGTAMVIFFIGFTMFFLGVANYLYTYVTRSRFTNMSVFMFVAAIIIFMMSLISEQLCQMRFERRGADRPIKKAEPQKKDRSGS